MEMRSGHCTDHGEGLSLSTLEDGLRRPTHIINLRIMRQLDGPYEHGLWLGNNRVAQQAIGLLCPKITM